MTTWQCNERLTGKPKDGQCQKCIEVVKGKSLFSLKQSFYLLLIELLSLFTTNLGKTKICGYKYSILQLDSGIKCYFQQASPFRTHSTLPQAPLPILHHSDKRTFRLKSWDWNQSSTFARPSFFIASSASCRSLLDALKLLQCNRASWGSPARVTLTPLAVQRGTRPLGRHLHPQHHPWPCGV